MRCQDCNGLLKVVMGDHNVTIYECIRAQCKARYEWRKIPKLVKPAEPHDHLLEQCNQLLYSGAGEKA